MFLQDITARMSTVCNSPLRFTKETLYWQKSFPSADMGDKIFLTKNKNEKEKIGYNLKQVSTIKVADRGKPFRYIDSKDSNKPPVYSSHTPLKSRPRPIPTCSNNCLGREEPIAGKAAENLSKSREIKNNVSKENIIDVPDSPCLDQLVPDELLLDDVINNEEENRHKNVNSCKITDCAQDRNTKVKTKTQIQEPMQIVPSASTLNDSRYTEQIGLPVESKNKNHISDDIFLCRPNIEKPYHEVPESSTINRSETPLSKVTVTTKRNKETRAKISRTLFVPDTTTADGIIAEEDAVNQEGNWKTCKPKDQSPTKLTTAQQGLYTCPQGLSTAGSVTSSNGGNQKIIPAFGKKKKKKELGSQPVTLSSVHEVITSQSKEVIVRKRPSFIVSIGNKVLKKANLVANDFINGQSQVNKVKKSKLSLKKQTLTAKQNSSSKTKIVSQQTPIISEDSVSQTTSLVVSTSNSKNNEDSRKNKPFCPQAAPVQSSQAMELAMHILSQASNSGELSQAINDGKLDALLESPYHESKDFKMSSQQSKTVLNDVFLTPKVPKNTFFSDSQFQTPDSTVVKKQRTKPKIQENVDIEEMARNKQLNKVNAVTLRGWLKSKGVSTKTAEKKDQLVKKVEVYLNIYLEDLTNDVRKFIDTRNQQV